MKTLLTSIILLASLAVLLIEPETANVARGQEQKTTAPGAPIKVTIQTARNELHSVTDSFHVGDEILIPITMTNTSTGPVDVCSSSDLYQDLPTLKRNGATVPIMDWESRVKVIAQRDETCEKLNVPDPINLNPNESKMVDWLVLVDSKVPSGADAWYDSLPPGKYELSIERQLGCCDGPRVQSNKVTFEVLP